MKFLAGLIGGLILAFVGTILITVMLAASTNAGAVGAAAFFVLWIASIVIALIAKSAGKAWRRLLITSGIVALMWPLAGVIYTGAFMATHVDTTSAHSGAQTAGAAIGGGLVSGVLGFIGFFLAVVLILIGLLVGREKQVVYVQAPLPAADTTAQGKVG